MPEPFDAQAKARFLLPSSATKLERDIVAASGEVFGLDVEIVRQLDPMNCDADMLPYLAWAWSIDFWDADWPEIKQRNVIANAVHLHRIKGTMAGIREYVRIAGGELVDVRRPPQKTFLAANPDKAAREAQLAELPELRVFIQRRAGLTDCGVYLGDGFFDGPTVAGDFIQLNRGSDLWRRRATLYRNGSEDEIEVESLPDGSERISVHGNAGDGLFLGDGFVGVQALDAVLTASALVTVDLDREYRHEESVVWLDMVAPGLTPVSPRYERASLQGEAPASLFFGTFLNDDFYLEDKGVALVYDRLRLIDTNIISLQHSADDFWGHCRLGQSPFTAEVMVYVERFAPSAETFADYDFFGWGYYVKDNLDIQDQVMTAISVAKSHRDKILVTFETTRPIQFGDHIPADGSVTFDDRVRRYL